MVHFISRFVTLVLALTIASCTDVQNQPSMMEQVKAELCDKQVVLLGESGYHGDGATEQFKADLIPTLVNDCGFNLVLFEAPFYEFAKLNRQLEQGGRIEPSDMARAIGGLWKDDQEVQGLIDFLTEGANDGTLKVAGIDDQIRSRGQDYAYGPMVADVVKGLDPDKATDCMDLLVRVRDENFPDDDPYTKQKFQALEDCFSTVSDDVLIDGLRANIKRYFARDFDRENYFAGRAESMFQNFEYWYDGQETNPKTIIWTATVHAAKARGHLGDPPNTGTFIRQRFGEQAYVLGFSALGGKYRKMRGKIFDVPDAPKDSIEYKVMTETEDEIRFLSHDDLRALGKAPASIYSYNYDIDEWSQILDGLIIFREQRPTTLLSSN